MIRGGLLTSGPAKGSERKSGVSPKRLFGGWLDLNAAIQTGGENPPKVVEVPAGSRTAGMETLNGPSALISEPD